LGEGKGIPAGRRAVLVRCEKRLVERWARVIVRVGDEKGVGEQGGGGEVVSVNIKKLGFSPRPGNLSRAREYLV